MIFKKNTFKNIWFFNNYLYFKNIQLLYLTNTVSVFTLLLTFFAEYVWDCCEIWNEKWRVMKRIAMCNMESVGLILGHDVTCCNIIHSPHSCIFLNLFLTLIDLNFWAVLSLRKNWAESTEGFHIPLPSPIINILDYCARCYSGKMCFIVCYNRWANTGTLLMTKRHSLEFTRAVL